MSTLTDQFRAVVEGGEKLDFTSGQNRELMLRALPLAGTSAEITWTVTRDAPSGGRRLLTISYSLGADGSVETSTKIGVLPAVRTSQQDSAVTYTEQITNSYDDGSESSFNRTVVSDKPTEIGAGMSTVAIVLASVAAAGAVVAVILVAVCKNRVATGAGGGPLIIKNAYAAIPTMDWSRDRFKPDFL